MHSNLGTSQIDPANIDEGARRVKEMVVPVLKQQKGFKNIYVLADRKTGKLYSMTFWESENDLKAFVGSDTQKQMVARMRDNGAPELDWNIFEVTVHA